jgi:hypothetical protein
MCVIDESRALRSMQALVFREASNRSYRAMLYASRRISLQRDLKLQDSYCGISSFIWSCCRPGHPASTSTTKLLYNTLKCFLATETVRFYSLRLSSCRFEDSAAVVCRVAESVQPRRSRSAINSAYSVQDINISVLCTSWARILSDGSGTSPQPCAFFSKTADSWDTNRSGMEVLNQPGRHKSRVSICKLVRR